ncbi:hypothetical protein DSM110093_02140 [Sulfitobacter sp. DSM 110093]|uniref:hypothetical protein n=1 Tax=Sulfitobacter sp. DSM 110093 TaxID=2883127 RepID=UPI001FAD7B69|nr:hypothetical protein [Sulfitobacter sp. DSM 110093]UOA32348.1 hypothetical protein DSM110093_02140 [Sulfitobacter sp. DSM 110093]
MRKIALTLICLLPLQAAAQAYRAENWLTVVPLTSRDFEVIEDRGAGARQLWCAAADFAENVIGLPRDERLFIKTPRGPSVSGVGRIGVVFTTDPERVSGDTGKSYSVTVRRAGENLPSHHARQFCLDRLIELEDF